MIGGTAAEACSAFFGRAPCGALLGLGLGLAWPGLAAAGTDAAALEAEHVRLTEEIEQFAERSAWRGVDATYRKLEALEGQGVPLTFQDLYAGAQAARALGNVSDAYDRLTKAATLERTDEIAGWLGEIEATYGSVDLYVDPRYKDSAALVPDEMPFDPSLRHVVEVAAEDLEASRAYRGLLPHGGYTFGTEHFDVVGGSSTITVELLGRGGKKADRTVVEEHTEGTSEGVAYVGPRLLVAPVYTQATTPSAGGLAPPAFGGPGVALSGGIETGWASRLGVFADLGYRGLWGDNGLQATDRFPTGPDTMHLGSLWVGGSYRLGDLGFNLGPSLAMGTAQVAGVADTCKDAAEPLCKSLDTTDDDTLAYQRLVGFVRTVGATVSVYYQFAYVSDLRAGVGLVGGAQHDGARAYPWGGLALSILPPPPRR